MVESKARWKRLIAFMLAFAMVFSSIAVSSFGTVTVQAASKNVKKVTLKVAAKDVTKKAVSVYSGSKKTLKVLVSPSNAKKKVTFKSSKPSVASVTKKGVITGKKKGTAKINVTVTGKDNKKTKTYVNVNVKYVKLSLNKKNASVNAGKSITLKAASTPKKTVKWSTSNKAVATVSSKGVVKGVKAGTATITAAVGQKKAACKVTVKGSAEVAVTEVKASIESAEISVGNGTQITASVLPANATNKTLTYSSSDESVATVNEAGVVLGTGAGTATITVRSANGKTASVQVTVAYVNVTGITVSPNELSLGVSAAEDLTAVIEPANASAKLVKWSSDNEAVATVDENGKVTGVAVGTARITASATDESGVSGTCVVNVEDSDGVTMELANPYTENGKSIPNTVLYGNDMDIRVRARKGNQPLPNAKVTLKMKKVTDDTASTGNARYEIKEDYATTDSDGYVDFVIGLKQDQADTKAFDGTGLAEVYNVTASEVSSGKKAELIVNTATLDLRGINVANSYKNGLVLEPSTNWKNGGNALYTTGSLDNKKSQEYVVSQKVSPVGTDKNRVEFAPSLAMKYGQNKKAEQGDWTPVISGTGASDTYTVYNDLSNEKTTTQILSVPNGLKYITLKFKEISLSDYTKILVGLYAVDEQGNLNPRPIANKSKEITRANNTTSVYSVQIDADTAKIPGVAECRLVISVITKGQVSQTEKGYQLDSVVGQWGTEKTAAVDSHPLPDGTVNWSIVSEEVSSEQADLTPADAKNKYHVPVTDAEYANYKYTYSVPVFPYTGDAFITVTDKNNSVKGIYAHPTENVGNKNVLAESWGLEPVFVSTDESANIANAVLTTSGNNAIVNAETTGRTNLKATININGLTEDEFNKQNGKELYTSVQWAPVSSSPDPGQAASNADYYALEGQVVTVTAQLLDSNENKMASNGQTINFTQGNSNTAITNLTTGSVIAQNGNYKVVLASDVTQTDSNGQVRMILLGDGMSYIKNLKASCPGYRVDLEIQNGSEKISINKGADIYWVDLGVEFTDSAITNDLDPDKNGVTTSQWDNFVADTERPSQSEIMQDWYVGYLPVARVANGAIDDFEAVNIPIDYTVSSNSVSINSAANKIESFTITDKNKAQYLTNTSNNVASIHSDRNIDMYLTGKINASTIASAGNVSFTFKKDGKEETRSNVGSGISGVISETGLKHTIEWQSSGMKATIEPASSLVNTGVSTNVVFKVGDNYGNVLKETKLQYKVVMPGGNTLEGEATTAENGSCSIEIPAESATVAGACFINVSGVVGNTNITASHTITYREAAAGMVDEQAEIDEVTVDESPSAGIAGEQPNADVIAN